LGTVTGSVNHPEWFLISHQPGCDTTMTIIIIIIIIMVTWRPQTGDSKKVLGGLQVGCWMHAGDS